MTTDRRNSPRDQTPKILVIGAGKSGVATLYGALAIVAAAAFAVAVIFGVVIITSKD